jgi:broad specificity phosphatase PhoE
MTPKEREAFYATGEKDDKEPWEDLCNRMMSCVKKYAKLYENENIIMISHGASINSVLSVLSNGEIGTRKTILKNTCINILNYEKNEFQIDLYNVTADEYCAIKGNKMFD